MPYYPILPNADDRKRRGFMPIVLRNCLVEPAEAGAQGRAAYKVVPAPGRTRRVELPANLRGIYAAPGVQNAGLFGVAGSGLYSVSAGWSATPLATVGGTDYATWAPFRSKLALLCGSIIRQIDGATVTQVTDVDAPSSPMTLAQAGFRISSAQVGGDAFGWSKAGDMLDWDPNGQAADFELPDPIVAQEEQGGDLINFNAKSIQRWRPTGGIESEAFAPVGAQVTNVGCLGQWTVSRVNGGLGFLSDNHVPHWLGSGAPTPWPNRAFVDEFTRLSTPAQALALGFSYADQGVFFYGLQAPGMKNAYVRDLSNGLWHERSRYGKDTYDVGFSAVAYDSTLVAGPNDPYIWSLERSVYTDDGDPIERVMTIQSTLPEDLSINSLSFDIKCFDQPLTGTGSAPMLMVEYSYDGGSVWSSSWGDVRMVSLPANGQHGLRPTEWQFGQFSRNHGAMFRITITDPIGFAIQGVWINEGIG